MSTTRPVSTTSNADQQSRGRVESTQKYVIVPRKTVPDFNPRKKKWCEYKERFENAA